MRASFMTARRVPGRELRGLGRRKRVGLEIAHGGHVGPERPGDALSDAAGDAEGP